MKLVFPDRPIAEISNTDSIFHTVFDLDQRYQITGAEHLALGYKSDGRVPHWSDHGGDRFQFGYR